MGGEARALGGEARQVSEPPAARGGWDEGPRGGGRLGARAHGVGSERLGDEGEPEREREGKGKDSTVIAVGLQAEQDSPGGTGAACRGGTGRTGPPCASGGDELGGRELEGDVGDSLRLDSCPDPRPVWSLVTRWE